MQRNTEVVKELARLPEMTHQLGLLSLEPCNEKCATLQQASLIDNKPLELKLTDIRLPEDHPFDSSGTKTVGDWVLSTIKDTCIASTHKREKFICPNAEKLAGPWTAPTHILMAPLASNGDGKAEYNVVLNDNKRHPDRSHRGLYSVFITSTHAVNENKPISHHRYFYTGSGDKIQLQLRDAKEMVINYLAEAVPEDLALSLKNSAEPSRRETYEKLLMNGFIIVVTPVTHRHHSLSTVDAIRDYDRMGSEAEARRAKRDRDFEEITLPHLLARKEARAAGVVFYQDFSTSTPKCRSIVPESKGWIERFFSTRETSHHEKKVTPPSKSQPSEKKESSFGHALAGTGNENKKPNIDATFEPGIYEFLLDESTCYFVAPIVVNVSANQFQQEVKDNVAEWQRTVLAKGGVFNQVRESLSRAYEIQADAKLDRRMMRN